MIFFLIIYSTVMQYGPKKCDDFDDFDGYDDFDDFDGFDDFDDDFEELRICFLSLEVF